MSKRDWTLLRVAVVQCVNDVYYGRLFFGDPDTQQVLWDTDVRPSDATFLALKVCLASQSSRWCLVCVSSSNPGCEQACNSNVCVCVSIMVFSCQPVSLIVLGGS